MLGQKCVVGFSRGDQASVFDVKFTQGAPQGAIDIKDCPFVSMC